MYTERLLLLCVVAFATVILGINAGEFYIASAPKSIEFLPTDVSHVNRRDLSGIINFLMGLPSGYLHRTDSWQGLKSIDVFNPPKANMLITLHLPKGNDFILKKYVTKYAADGIESRVSPVHELNSVLVNDQDLESVRQYALTNQFQGSSFGDVDFSMTRDGLFGEDSVLNGLPFETEFLTPQNNIDINLFGEIQMLQDVSEKLSAGKPGDKLSFHILLTSLDNLAQEYGETSPQVKEAIKLFQYYIPQLIEVAEAEFEGKLLCEVDITSSPLIASKYLVRHSRSLLQAESEPILAADSTNFTQLNLAEPNSENFAVVFSIVLWLMIGFFAAVLAAAYSMWYMDPGKDNIIYRVTSTRMKSD